MRWRCPPFIGSSLLYLRKGRDELLDGYRDKHSNGGGSRGCDCLGGSKGVNELGVLLRSEKNNDWRILFFLIPVFFYFF